MYIIDLVRETVVSPVSGGIVGAMHLYVWFFALAFITSVLLSCLGSALTSPEEEAPLGSSKVITAYFEQYGVLQTYLSGLLVVSILAPIREEFLYRVVPTVVFLVGVWVVSSGGALAGLDVSASVFQPVFFVICVATTTLWVLHHDRSLWLTNGVYGVFYVKLMYEGLLLELFAIHVVSNAVVLTATVLLTLLRPVKSRSGDEPTRTDETSLPPRVTWIPPEAQSPTSETLPEEGILGVPSKRGKHAADSHE
jgi:hypothetical protein